MKRKGSLPPYLHITMSLHLHWGSVSGFCPSWVLASFFSWPVRYSVLFISPQTIRAATKRLHCESSDLWLWDIFPYSIQSDVVSTWSSFQSVTQLVPISPFFQAWQMIFQAVFCILQLARKGNQIIWDLWKFDVESRLKPKTNQKNPHPSPSTKLQLWQALRSLFHSNVWLLSEWG